jgi:hypothetical protein
MPHGGHVSRPLCLVMLPFGPASPAGDFYFRVIGPAIEDAGLQPLRAERGAAEAEPHRRESERLLLAEYAVVDVTSAAPWLVYLLGVRGVLRPAGTVLVCSAPSHSVPDLPRIRPIVYDPVAGLPAGKEDRLRSLLSDTLREARKRNVAVLPEPAVSLYELLEGRQGIEHTKTDVFRAKVEYSEEYKEKLREARLLGATAVRQAEHELSPLAEREAGVVIDLLLSYRAVKAWGDMVALEAKMSPELAATALVREQIALARNRVGEGGEAERILLRLIERRGPSSETCGILGRIYKDRWEAALRSGDAGRAPGLLDQAVEAYLRGFEADWRDAYPGLNAVTLMELRDPPDPRRFHLVPVVRYAVERRIASGAADYWDRATLVELAVLADDVAEAEGALGVVLGLVREPWEPETTARNLGLIRESRERRGIDASWIRKLEEALLHQARQHPAAS